MGHRRSEGSSDNRAFGAAAACLRDEMRADGPPEERGLSDNQRLRRSRSASHLLACGKKAQAGIMWP